MVLDLSPTFSSRTCSQVRGVFRSFFLSFLHPRADPIRMQLTLLEKVSTLASTFADERSMQAMTNERKIDTIVMLQLQHITICESRQTNRSIAIETRESDSSLRHQLIPQCSGAENLQKSIQHVMNAQSRADRSIARESVQSSGLPIAKQNSRGRVSIRITLKS